MGAARRRGTFEERQARAIARRAARDSAVSAFMRLQEAPERVQVAIMRPSARRLLAASMIATMMGMK